MLDFEGGYAGLGVVPVHGNDAAPVGNPPARGAFRDRFHVLVGVAHLELEAIVEALGEAQGHDRAFAFVVVPKLGHVGDVQVIEIGVDGAAVRRHAQGLGFRELRLREVRPEEAVPDLGIEHLGGHRVVIAEIKVADLGIEGVIHPKRGLPVRGDLEILADDVDGHARAGGDVIEQHLGNGAEVADVCVGAREDRERLEGVGNPHLRIAAGEEPEAAGDLRAGQAGPAEAHPGLDQVEAIDVGGAGDAVAIPKVLAEGRGVALGEGLVAHAEVELEVVPQLPGVLEEEGGLLEAPGRGGVVGVVAGRIDVLNAGIAVHELVVAKEAEATPGAGHEGVEEIVLFVLGAGGDEVIAQKVIGGGKDLQPLILKGVEVAEAVATADEV